MSLAPHWGTGSLVEAEVLHTNEEPATLFGQDGGPARPPTCLAHSPFLRGGTRKLPLEGGAPLMVRGIRSAP